MPNDLVEILLLFVLSMQAVGLAFLFKRLEDVKWYIARLHSDGRKPTVTPEQVEIWKRQVAKLTPGCTKWKAYRRSLKNIGEWDGD